MITKFKLFESESHPKINDLFSQSYENIKENYWIVDIIDNTKFMIILKHSSKLFFYKKYRINGVDINKKIFNFYIDTTSDITKQVYNIQEQINKYIYKEKIKEKRNRFNL